MTIVPSRADFSAQCRQGNVVPVFADLVADSETPTSVFQKLDDGGFGFLLESAELREQSGRFSFLGLLPHRVVRGEANADADPVAALAAALSDYRFVQSPALPGFSGGAVGFLGYDVVRHLEKRVPAAATDDLQLPEMIFAIMRLIVIFDHQHRRVKIVANAFVDSAADADRAYDDAVALVEQTLARMNAPSHLPFIDAGAQPPALEPRSNTTRERFENAVGIAKEHIAAGDIFQVVLSQRFEAPFNGDPLTLYRCLRLVNPSPYMFCLRFGAEFSLIGSSPEMHVRVTGDHVQVRPIAGTRRRGATPEQDEANARELCADEKERAEHVMLIDLARNDVGRVATIGSVRVTEQMAVERYSHVMHLVSRVEGTLRNGANAFDALRATFPAGTVSGAPKIRAMQLIAELEGTRRGCYAGAVGYFGFDGALDCCIALRSIVLKHGTAYVQAGAGIVADSDASAEYRETCSKAAAMLEAISRANQLTP